MSSHKMKSEKEKTVIDGSRDIISTLPDELICHILSFLPTKEAASTSVLAKRWKSLVAFVPSLYFDDSSYFHHAMTHEEWKHNRESFKLLVESVLALQGKLNARLDRFYLKCIYDGFDDYSVVGWISEVLKRDVLDIDLYISLYGGLPSNIFVSKTLVKLKIVFVENVSIYSVFSLPKLKTLHLDYFRIETDTFNKLFSGCHALEELVLVDLMWVKYSEAGRCPVTLSIPTLRRLKFCRSQDFREMNEDEEGVSLSFDNPNLVYLEYSDDIVDRFQQVCFGSLVEANLSLGMNPDQTVTGKISVTKLFVGIRNVKILYLSDDTLKVLACYREAIPVFKNLVELTIKTSTYEEWELLPYLLKNCPSLQTLVFEELHCEDDNVWRVVKMDVCSCLSSSKLKVLKILKLGEYDDGDHCHEDDPDGYCHEDHVVQDQIQCVKLFLETMPDLEQVILYYNTSDDEDVMEVFKKLEKLPRVASGNCNVQLKSDNLSLSSSSASSSASSTWTKRGTLI